MKHYHAPWGLTFIIVLLLVAGVCLGTGIDSWFGAKHGNGASFWLGLSALALGLGTTLYHSWTHHHP